MLELDPLLASAQQVGKLTIPLGLEGTFVVGPGAMLSRTDLQFTRHPTTGKPTHVSGPAEAIRRFARQSGLIVTTTGVSPSTQKSNVPISQAMISPEIEIAVLKGVLLTFDHVCRDSDSRFTRARELEPLRDMMRAVIMEDADRGRLLFDCVLGIDYTLRERIDDICKKRNPSSDSPFRHALIATANAAKRTIDLVWCLFGFEPHRFRLTREWRGVDFTFLVTNGVLRDTTVAGPIECGPFDIGPRSNACATPIDPAWLDFEVHVMAEHREHAHIEARLLTLRRDDSTVRRNIRIDTALYVATPETPGSVADGMKRVLSTLFAVNLKQADTRLTFEQIVRIKGAALGITDRTDTIARDDEIAEHVDWPYWVSAFRNVMEELVREIGPPRIDHSRRPQIRKI